MSKNDWRDLDDDDEGLPKDPTPVIDLPYYETLRIILEPYCPAKDLKDADHYFSSPEIISSIEQHHGIPQGIIGGTVQKFVFVDDFVRAMKYLGYQEGNAGGVQLQWLLKKKQALPG